MTTARLGTLDPTGTATSGIRKRGPKRCRSAFVMVINTLNLHPAVRCVGGPGVATPTRKLREEGEGQKRAAIGNAAVGPDNWMRDGGWEKRTRFWRAIDGRSGLGRGSVVDYQRAWRTGGQSIRASV